MNSNATPSIPLSRLRLVLILISWTAVGIGLVLSIAAYPQLPERIPIHFNAQGEPDGWGGPATVFILPIVNFFLCGFMSVLALSSGIRLNLPFHPTEENKLRHLALAKTYLLSIMCMCALFFCWISAETIQLAHQENPVSNSLILVIFLAALTVSIPVYFYAASRIR